MDYGLIDKVVAELAEDVLPAKVSKVYQPDADLLIFKLWNGQDTFRLLLSAEPGHSRVHVTSREWLNPSRPPRFCQLLRARVKQIRSVELKADDRIVTFYCSGPSGECRLVAELTGKHPNLILIDEKRTIIDTHKRVAADSEGRSLLAGKEYVFPAPMDIRETAHDLLKISTGSELPFNQLAEQLSVAGKAEDLQDLHRLLLKLVSRQIKKLDKRLVRIREDLDRQMHPEINKIRGELILANLHQLKRGLRQVEVINYYSDPPQSMVVELDPVLDGQGNAERYFKIYKKYKRAADHHERRIAETEEELGWLRELEYQLNETVKNSDIDDIAEELRTAGLLKDTGGLNARRTSSREGPRATRSPGGLSVVWGRNNRQNDEVTTRQLKSGDLWFHAHKIPGAHVVLKTAGATPDEEDILFAARIAAGYSKGRHDSRVDVMEAVARNVEKKKGSHPGQVFVRDYKVRLVAPLRID